MAAARWPWLRKPGAAVPFSGAPGEGNTEFARAVSLRRTNGRGSTHGNDDAKATQLSHNESAARSPPHRLQRWPSSPGTCDQATTSVGDNESATHMACSTLLASHNGKQDRQLRSRKTAQGKNRTDHESARRAAGCHPTPPDLLNVSATLTRMKQPPPKCYIYPDVPLPPLKLYPNNLCNSPAACLKEACA
jgi:hypothetical protein